MARFVTLAFLAAGAAAVSLALLAPRAEAQEAGKVVREKGPFSVTPLVIDEKGQPRDIIKNAITLTNNTGQRLDVYADVRNFDPSAGAVTADFSAGAHVAKSLANWVEITRGVIELEPNESVQIPYLIHINLRAKPGLYYAELVFAAGSSRKKAFSEGAYEERALMTVEVLDDAVEKLQLDTFMPEKSIFSGDTATFTFALKNVGNRTVVPRGEIRIYNRRGQEVASLPANGAAETLSPSGKQQLAAVWDAKGRFGKYKAFLDLEYGQTGTVQDTVYFWVFPWREVLIGFFLLLVLIVSVTYLIHLRATYGPRAQAAGAGMSVEEEYERAMGALARAAPRAAGKPAVRAPRAMEAVTPAPAKREREAHRGHVRRGEGGAAAVGVARRTALGAAGGHHVVQLPKRKA